MNSLLLSLVGSFQLVSQADRVVVFSDRSYGNITSWHWEFGDGQTSSEGPEGKAKRTKVWDVTLP